MSSPYGPPANSLKCPLKSPDFFSMFDAFVRTLLLLFLKILFHIRIPLGHMSRVTCHVSPAVTCHLSEKFRFLEIFKKKKLQICQGPFSTFTCHLSPVACHMSPVTCHLSLVACHLSHVTCHLSPVTCHLSPALPCLAYLLSFGGGAVRRFSDQ